MERSSSHRRWAAALLAVVTVAFAIVVLPFVGAIFWSVVLAIVFDPLQAWILARSGQRRTAAALATLAVVVAGVGIPVAVVAALVVRQGTGLYDAIAAGRIDVGESLQRAAQALPHWLLGVLDALGLGDPGAVQARLVAGAGEASRFAATHVFRLGVNSFSFALSVAVMLYLLFFFLRDGRALVARIDKAIPLAGHDKQTLLATFVVVIRATVKGGVVMAVVQGTLGGVVLGALGVTAPLLWGVVFGLVSMLPAIGAAVVWLPIALYFLVTGAFAKALLLILFGSVVLTVVDNVLRPILVGRETHLPGYLVLISTLGGVAIFGLNGIVVGPMAAAMFVATWALFNPKLADDPAAPVDTR
ncbi:MAG: AI-2E family transporter [Caldimonas sp.]